MIDIFKKRAVSDLKKEVRKQIGSVLYEQTNFDALFEAVVNELANDVKKWSDNEERIQYLKDAPSQMIGRLKNILGVDLDDDDNEYG